MKAKLIKNGNAYSLKINGEYVAFANEDFVGYATQEFRDNLLGKLSLKNCQAIEHGYDLDELIDKYCRGNSKIEDDFIKKGFQKALSILGDKKFSERDILKTIELSREGIVVTRISEWETEKEFDYNETQIIQSLQPSEWEVIIKMKSENVRYNGGKQIEYDVVPLLDAGGCLILKRK
jgi:hypothetical protein